MISRSNPNRRYPNFDCSASLPQLDRGDCPANITIMSEPMSDADKVRGARLKTQNLLILSDPRQTVGQVRQHKCCGGIDFKHISTHTSVHASAETCIASHNSDSYRATQAFICNQANSNNTRQHHPAKERDEWFGETKFKIGRNR